MPKGGGNAGGGGGGFFRGLFTLALIALVGYNTYEIHALKSELAAERHRPNRPTPKIALASITDGAPTDALSPYGLAATKNDLLRAAQNHIADAERYLHVKRYAEARDELSAAARSFTRANAETKAQGEQILAQLRNATKALTMTGDDAASAPAQPPAKSSENHDTP